MYSAALPPWDYTDEEQHVHYIQHLVERHELPVMGTTYLSPEIVASAFETDRWQRLGLSRPPSNNPMEMGLEGLSYEAYQPPLFYLMLATPYALLPNPMLVKLYGLRALVVLMGTLSVLGSYTMMRTIWPGEKALAVVTATLLVLIPERAMAVSRVNNDALAELAAISVLLLLVVGMRCRLDPTSAVAMGLAMGLAFLSKLNALALVPAVLVVWGATYRKAGLAGWIARGSAVAMPAVVVSGWLFYRNVVMYGDLSGVAGFQAIARFSPKSSVPEVLAALARGFWGMWWWSWPIYVMGFLGALVLCVSLVGLIASYVRGNFTVEQKVMVLALVAMLLSAIVGVWLGAVGGWVPSVQGRLMLPAYAPAVGLSLVGFLRLTPPWAHKAFLGAALVAALVLNAYVLSYLLPYEYPSA